MKNAFLQLFLVLLAVQAIAQNSDEILINSHRYVFQENAWYQIGVEGSAYLVDNRVITIKLREGFQGFENEIADAYRGRVLSRARTGFVDILVPKDVDVLDYVLSLQSDEAIEIAEVNTIGQYLGIPNDTQYAQQWHLPQIMMPDAWDIQTGDPNVIVGVLDSGTNFNHPDLGPGADAYENIWLNPEEDPWSDPTNPATGNGIDGGNGFVDDWKGWDFENNNNDPSSNADHGSWVAGCISAKTNNGVGVAGVAGGWNSQGVSVMIAGVGSSFPIGAILDDAILYAVDNGARIIQMSLTVGQSAAIDAALQMAYEVDGALNVCATGNDSAASIGYPSSNSFVMGVGATTQSDQRASFSNFGTNIEIAAPGVDIRSTGLGSSYQSVDGTSFAAPITSAVAALLWSQDPSLTNDEVRQILKDTADKVGGYNYNWDMTRPGHSRELGYGRVNAFEALSSLETQLTYPELLEMWPNNVSIFDLLPFIPLITF